MKIKLFSVLLLFAACASAQLPSGWSWVNQGSSSIDSSNGNWYISATAVSNTHSVRMVEKATPTPPYSATVRVNMLAAATGSWDAMTGIAWRESATGKLTTCHHESNSSTAFSWYANAVYWTSPTSPNSVVGQEQYRITGDEVLIKASDDGTNRQCDVSFDAGLHWLNFYSQGRTVNMTADQIGFFTDNWEGSRTGAFSGVVTYYVDSWSSDTVAYSSPSTPPIPGSLSGWTETNGSGATTDDTYGTFAVGLTSPALPAQNTVLITQPASWPFTAEAVVGMAPAGHGTYWDLPAGLAFLDTVSGRFVTCQFENDPDGWFYSASYWADSNSQASADLVSEYYRPLGYLGILRGSDDGINRTCEVSIDGTHWQNFYTESRTNRLTATDVGFSAGLIEGTSGIVSLAALLGWSIR